MMAKPLKQYIYIITALLLCAAPIAAQHTVKGVVLEETGKGVFTPLPFATIHWANTTVATTTDTNGVFTIPHAHGQTMLVVGYVGLQPDTLAVTPENMNNLRIVLKTAVALEEVEVTAETRGLTLDRLNPIKTTIMTEKELFKAACCNLSESFETNPAVDVTISDAVTGTKQIQMLGLAGIYTQITTENMPGTRGLASSNGLGYLPGTWIESIQVTKGIGSVANGYESITGQINTELRKPDGVDRAFANVYTNSQGRAEGNLVLTQDVGKKWGTALLLHGSTFNNKVDMNNDGYRDMPTGYQLNAINRWKYSNMRGLSAQIGVKALLEEKTGGDIRFDGNRNKAIINGIFGASIKTERFEVWGKTGYVFPEKKYQSIGFMWSALTHTQHTFFGTKTYNNRQQTLYANLIYQSIIGNTNHKYRTGLSFLRDVYTEEIALQYNNPQALARTEIVPGAFFEYTWTASPRWTVIAGLRGDYHNLFGFFATPRINARYSWGKGSVLHFTAGRGQRTANIFAENMQLLASSRAFVLPPNWQTTPAYNLKAEVAWNYGLSYTTEIRVAGRNATLEADVFHTRFQNQVVVDLDNTARQAVFYNLQGQSYANSAQVQLTYEPIRRFEIRMAYRYYDVRTQYQSGLLQRYLLSPHRAFINASYKTRSKWLFDATATWFGPKRLPNTQANPESLQLPVQSPSYVIVHAQVTKTIGKKWDVYAGVENLLDFRQTRLIVDPANPTGTYFDASMIWGPVQGRMIYVGARFRIKK